MYSSFLYGKHYELTLTHVQHTCSLPPHRDASPATATSMASLALLQLAGKRPRDIGFLDPVKDLKMNTMEFIELKRDKEQFENTMEHYSCIRCPQFVEHVS